MGNKKTEVSPQGKYPKVMLMGCGNDGKSTIFNQIQKLYNYDQFEKLTKEVGPCLLKNFLRALEKIYEYFYTRGHFFDNPEIRVQKKIFNKS
jgi:GTP-binding protein EngB required for normal cell division